MRNSLLYATLLLILQTLPLQAQYHLPGTPSVNNFTKTNYNAGTQNWDILQSPSGIIYFGNNKGLLEFDGTNWKVLPLPNRTIVRSLAIDDQGRIYLGSQDDFGYLNKAANGALQFASMVDLVPEGYRSFEDIWKVFTTTRGVFFCAQEAIFILRGEDLQVIQPRQRFQNFYYCRGDVIVQENSGELYIWRENDFQPFVTDNSVRAINIMEVLPYLDNQLLAFTETDGLFVIERDKITPWTTQADDFLKSNNVYCASAIENGQYAIGTSTNGLLIINQQGEPVLHLNQATGLQNNTVLSIEQDYHQNLWLALDNGIDYVEINAPFSLVRSDIGVEGTGYAACLYRDKLYLGTNQGLFAADWTVKDNPFGQLSFDLVKNSDGQVWTLDQLDGQLLIGQHHGAYYLKDEQTQQFSEVNGAWKFMILKQHPDYAIEGTYSGILLYRRNRDATSGGFSWTFVHRLEGFDESARVMEEDNEGNIWVSHAYKGIFKVSLTENGQQIDSVAFYDSTNGLPTNISINVSMIRGELIFTTPQGIYAYDKTADHFVKHQELSDVFGDNRNVKRLLEDQNGNIWFSIDDEFGVLKVQEKGIYNKIDKHYFNHIQKELMEGYEYVYAASSDHIFIATEKGFIHYNPNREKKVNTPFKTLIRKVISTTQKDSLIAVGPVNSSAQELSFSPKINDFKFGFSAPYFEQIHQLHYRYRLEGFEEGWSEWGVQTEKEYTNLPHGHYSFVVQAQNAYGQLSEPAMVNFTIATPWYLTIVAKMIYLLAVMLLVWSLIRFYYRKVDQKTSALKIEQARTLQKKEAEFKQEVEKSEAEIIRLRNEKLRADISHKNSKLASAAMHLVQKGEILLKIKQDLNKMLPKAETDNKRKIKQLIRAIDDDIRLDNNWEQFELYFDQVHEDFLKRLRENYPVLTPKDQKLCAYLRMNLSTKEIAPLMNISVRGVEISRYRLRKKLELDGETNLVEFLIEI